ncbi:uncharacterized protein LOC115980533 [Quercus lobata]|uniref:uncharacterized protein LOC115980533 n=1 Tax=Quercus lobata TaxID=97700 RepID=UPI0012454BCA|nr:uncharacterized protein LOC115980533 [Quercus lobata]
MYPDLYKGLNLKPEDLTAYNSSLVSFEGKTITPRSQIRLPIQARLDVVEVDFIVVDAYSPYTVIVARPWLHALGAVSSTLHQKVKYPLEGQQSATPVLPSNELTEEAKCKDLEKVAVGIDPKKFFQVGSKLPPQEKEELIGFLRENVDIFVWDAYEAPRVDPSFIYHHLNVSPSVTPKKQPPQHPLKEHADAIKDEVTKLKKARAIKEVFYPEWLAITVVVKKKSRKWRVCVDFTDLNKAYPIDLFPMPG